MKTITIISDDIIHHQFTIEGCFELFDKCDKLVEMSITTSDTMSCNDICLLQDVLKQRRNKLK